MPNPRDHCPACDCEWEHHGPYGCTCDCDDGEECDCGINPWGAERVDD